MADKILVNLATGLEDPERVTVTQFADGGGELLLCPVCFNSRRLGEGSLVGNAMLAGATPMVERMGDDATAVFSY